jgi:hypothetical protein
MLQMYFALMPYFSLRIAFKQQKDQPFICAFSILLVESLILGLEFGSGHLLIDTERNCTGCKIIALGVCIGELVLM